MHRSAPDLSGEEPWGPSLVGGPFFEGVKIKSFISTKCLKGQASRQCKQQKKTIIKANSTPVHQES